jgi:hypothetical protein
MTGLIRAAARARSPSSVSLLWRVRPGRRRVAGRSPAPSRCAAPAPLGREGSRRAVSTIGGDAHPAGAARAAPRGVPRAPLLRVAAPATVECAPLIDLGRGNPETGPPPHVVEALTRAAERPDVHGYSPFRGLPELRQALAERYRTHYGVSLDPGSEVAVVPGTKTAIVELSLVLAEEGQTVVLPDPYYRTTPPGRRSREHAQALCRSSPLAAGSRLRSGAGRGGSGRLPQLPVQPLRGRGRGLRAGDRIRTRDRYLRHQGTVGVEEACVSISS